MEPSADPTPPRPAADLHLLELPEGGCEILIEGGRRRLRLSADAQWLLEHLDGRITYPELAGLLSQRTGRAVAAEQARALVERVLVEPGLTGTRKAAAPVRGRLIELLPAVAMRPLARLLAPLASRWGMPVSALAAVAAIAVLLAPRLLDAAAWRDGVAWLLVAPAVFASLFVHELLHAAALSAGGGSPGAVALITGRRWHLRAELPGMERLPLMARVRVDLAGAHGQLLSAAALAVVPWALGGSAPVPAVLAVLASAGANLVPADGHDGSYLLDDLADRPHGDAQIRSVPLTRTLAMGVRLAATGLALRLGRGPMAAMKRLIVVMIATSFPRQSAAWRRAFTLRHLVATEHLRLDMADVGRGRGADHVLHRTPLLECLRARRGVVVCSMHAGPFPYVPLTLAETGATVMLYATAEMQQLGLTAWQASAEQLGVQFEVLSPTSVRDAARALRGLREGRVLSILMDGQHSANRDQHRADITFMGAEFCMRTGPVVLATRARAPIVLAATRWHGTATRVVEFSDCFEPLATDADEAVVERTRALYDWFADRIAPRAHEWTGWTWPVQHWRASGRAPTATREALAEAQVRAQRALLGEPASARVLADDTLCAVYDSGTEKLLVQGDHRRVMRGSAAAVALLEAAFKRPRARELPARLGRPAEQLAPELARLMLAGLVTLQGGARGGSAR